MFYAEFMDNLMSFHHTKFYVWAVIAIKQKRSSELM
jgi:hypothetical protein